MRILLCLLLTMFLVLLLVGCSWKSESKSVAPDPEQQKATLAAIKELGGEVYFDKKNPDKPLLGVRFTSNEVTRWEEEQLNGRIRFGFVEARSNRSRRSARFSHRTLFILLRDTP